jgi:hypothetical protein
MDAHGRRFTSRWRDRRPRRRRRRSILRRPAGRWRCSRVGKRPRGEVEGDAGRRRSGRARKLSVEQLIERFTRNGVCVRYQVARNDEREGGVGAVPSGPSRQARQARHRSSLRRPGNAPGRPRSRSSRSCAPPALHRDQSAGDHEARADQSDANPERLERHGKDEPFDRLKGQHEGGAGERARLGEGGDRLALAVAEAMFAVRRPQGVEDAKERDEARADVDQRVDSQAMSAIEPVTSQPVSLTSARRTPTASVMRADRSSAPAPWPRPRDHRGSFSCAAAPSSSRGEIPINATPSHSKKAARKGGSH